MELYRERSYARCIADGWRFIGENLWKVTRIMAPWYLVCAIIYTVWNACSIYINVAEQANTEIEPKYAYTLFISSALFIIVTICAQGRLYLMFRRFSGNNDKTMKAIGELGFKSIIFFWLLWTPFFFPIYSWIMKEKGEKISFKQTLKKGWNHWGKIFGVVMLSGLIVGVANIILMVPDIFATSAYFSSIEGKINFGDTALIPQSGYVTMLIVCTICSAVRMLIFTTYHATMLYLYGDLKTREK